MLQNVYQQSSNCLVEDMDGELLIYNPQKASTVHLNGPSVLVWNCCNGEASVRDTIEALQASFPEQAAQISDDVVNVIKEFESGGLVSKVVVSP